VEGLLKQLAAKIPGAAVSVTNGSQTTDSLMKQLKQAEAQLDEQERLLSEISLRAKSRIKRESDDFNKKWALRILKWINERACGRSTPQPDWV
jgi:hypothetical protein